MNFDKTTGTLENPSGIIGSDFVVYTPKESLPCAVLQIVHGFNENVESYEKCGFIDAMTAKGYVVCALKLRGFVNGGTVYICNHESYTADISALFGYMRKTYRSLPFILYGHDFGSFIVRDYIVSSENSIDGAILSGAWDNFSKLGSEKLKAKFDKLMHGKDYSGKYSEKKIFGYNYAIDVEYYYTASSYLQCLSLIEKVSAPEWAGNVPLSLPMLLLASKDDTLEIDGCGVPYIHSLLGDAELCELKIKTYEASGHAPQYGADKDSVFADVTEWISDVCQGVVDWGTLKI